MGFVYSIPPRDVSNFGRQSADEERYIPYFYIRASKKADCPAHTFFPAPERHLHHFHRMDKVRKKRQRLPNAAD